ncbi:MAG: hypothetical protein K9G46_08770 [Flavobacteriales bacterium]|nr:hypothetical protein [Flavobacteriales bacterium]
MRKELVFILIVCILSRLPQLLSPNLLLDGDEAIVGLMAKHFSEGKELPFYFYGQSYGFSFLEVLPISLVFLLFGVSAMAVKLTMLLLFSGGVCLFYATLKHFPSGNKWIPLLITLLLTTTPAWAVWSMKARGGYISAFFLFPLFTYLLFSKRSETSLLYHAFFGLTLATIFECQALWLPEMLVFTTFRLFQMRSVKLLGAQLFGGAMGFGMFGLLKVLDTTRVDSFAPSVFSMPENLTEKLMALPKYLQIHFSGSYYLGDAIEPSLFTSIFAWILTTGLLVSTLILFFQITRKTRNNQLLFVSVVPVLFAAAVSIYTADYHARYLLPISGYFFLMLALLLSKFEKLKVVNALLVILIAANCYALISFKDYRFENGSTIHLNRAIRQLESNNVKYVFSQGALLQWQLMFYSNERLIARYYGNNDRYYPYIDAVNNGLRTEPDKVGLIGTCNQAIPMDDPTIWTFGSEYFTLVAPAKSKLEERGFRFD